MIRGKCMLTLIVEDLRSLLLPLLLMLLLKCIKLLEVLTCSSVRLG